MKDELAQSILKNEMSGWSLEKQISEISDMQIISEMKYDDYQQYTHGMRYIESIALWLRQFDDKKDKENAYDFIKKQLIFVSEEEMRQLVMYSYPLKMEQFILERTKNYCNCKGISDTEERRILYKYFRRRSLFMGLSDGAHMDFFRRHNAALSNEQVFVYYDFSEDKAREMKKDFMEDPLIKEVVEKYSDLNEGSLDTFFLIDDFSGSGKSFVRKEEENWKGKISRFMDLLDRQEDIFNKNTSEIHIVLYIATEQSLNYINKELDIFSNEKGLGRITVDCVQIVRPIDMKDQPELKDLLKRNYDKYISAGYESYEDTHFKKGNGKYPYLGFGDCSLPLVLFHNTPNNSLPVLWYSWGGKADALFPRITRHKEI